MEIKIPVRREQDATEILKRFVRQMPEHINPVFVIVPKEYGTAAYAQWIIRAAEALRTGKALKTIKAIPKEQHGRVEHFAKMYNNHSQLYIKLNGKAAGSYRSKIKRYVSISTKGLAVYYVFWRSYD
jgi:hypothetical protein